MSKRNFTEVQGSAHSKQQKHADILAYLFTKQLPECKPSLQLSRLSFKQIADVWVQFWLVRSINSEMCIQPVSCLYFRKKGRNKKKKNFPAALCLTIEVFCFIFYFSYLNKDQYSLPINTFSSDQKRILKVESFSKYIRYLFDVLVD